MDTDRRVIYACRQCMCEHPSGKPLLTQPCFFPSLHRSVPRVAVQWNSSAEKLESVNSGPGETGGRETGTRRTAGVRPLPRNVSLPPGRKFRLCNTLYGSCRGMNCKFAHSEEEVSAWNAQLTHSRRSVPRREGEAQGRVQLRPQWQMEPWPDIPAPLPGHCAPPIPQRSLVQHPSMVDTTMQYSPHPILESQPVDSTLSNPVITAMQPNQRRYAARSVYFSERIKEELFIDDIQRPLTQENYKEKFHKLLCWEEKKHIEILEERCRGRYKLVVYQKRFKPPWIQSTSERFGYIHGMDGDQIAYATQASESAWIIAPDVELKVQILKENFWHNDEHLYIAFSFDIAQELEKQLLVGEGLCNIEQIEIQFELKHSYFDNLHRSIDKLPPEVVAKLVPEDSSFRSIESTHAPLPRRYVDIFDSSTSEQVDALQVVAFCPSSAPPILISGPFGTGKTRLLATAAYFFLEEGKNQRQVTRVLICAHHQVSADTLVKCYLELMKSHAVQPWEVMIGRITSERHHPSDQDCREWCLTVSELKERAQQYRCQPFALIVTTFLTAMHLHGTFSSQFFTHILLDEGAQAREPEAVAPLCLATRNTKIVITGDSQQVGPTLVVLGEEARDNGLKVSLLERLLKRYGTSPVALPLCAKLRTNYRCHRGILNLCSKLFYDSSLKCHVPNDIAHRSCPFPLMFFCTSENEFAVGTISPPDKELEAVVDQAVQCIQHWPDSWGPKDLSEVSIITPSRSHISIMRKRVKQTGLTGIKMLTTFQIQGQEFLTVFLSTSEPTWKDGSTRNPTKSICDPFVFNTVLTRAKALVVAVGNPFTLLRSEQHMVKMYGQKGRCWLEFLKCCLQNNTLHALNATMLQRCKSRLGDILLRKQTPSMEKVAMKVPVVTGHQHIDQHSQHGSLVATHTESLQATVKTKKVSKSLSARGGSQLAVSKEATGTANTVTATQSKASTTAPVVPERTEANQTGSLPGNLQGPHKSPSSLRTDVGSSGTVKAPRRDGANPGARKPPVHQPLLQHPTNSREEVVQPNSKGMTLRKTGHSPMKPSQLDAAEFPTLEAARERAPKWKLREMQAAPPATALSRQHTDYYKQNIPSRCCTVKAPRRDSANPGARKPPVHQPLLQHPTNSREEVVQPNLQESKGMTLRKTGHSPMKPSQLDAAEFPTLEASRERVPKWKLREMQAAPPATALSRQHTDYYKQNKERLSLAVIEQELTRKNYKEKFHHLLCWEEKEHEKILAERCDGSNYVITVFQPGFKPDGLKSQKKRLHVRYGLISLEDDSGESISYAMQASEGAQVFLTQELYIHVDFVFAKPRRGEEAIVIAMDENNLAKLKEWDRRSKGRTCFQAYYVQFQLKHLYFQLLHNSLNKLRPEIIAKLLPDASHFQEVSVRNFKLARPSYERLTLDKSGQMQALEAIIDCDSLAPVLVVGPFGTGKTRLLARASYQILRNRKNRVLVCAHHQASVDTFVEYFGEMKEDLDQPWEADFVRIVPYSGKDKTRQDSKTSNNFGHYYKTSDEIKSLESAEMKSYRLVVSTLLTSPCLLGKVSNGFFTHILLDEGAQTREPDAVAPLCLANNCTKIVIAGDHCQVGPRLLVLGEEPQKHGLAVSLLERLHKHYQHHIGEAAEPYSCALLTNYRCHSGILMLPSSLYYDSTLQCRVPEDSAHPAAPFPLVFVCTSFNDSKEDIINSELERDIEARTLLHQVMKYKREWPKSSWGERVNPGEMCIMTPSARQKNRIVEMMKEKQYSSLRGVEVLKAYDIQGREFRAIFIGTCEAISEDGKPLNPTKSICDCYVFNTALTRSRSLVVAVGNPFTLLRMETQMVKSYGEKGRCWSKYIQRCLDCKSFCPRPSFGKKAMESDLEGFPHAKEQLYRRVYGRDSQATSLSSTQPIHQDSILSAYQKKVKEIPGCQELKLTLCGRGGDLSWGFKDSDQSQLKPEREENERGVSEGLGEAYKCVLHIEHYRKAEARPFDSTKHVISMNSPRNRNGAFDGETVLAAPFLNNPQGRHNGRIIDILQRSPIRRFVCRVTMNNSVLFSPIDGKNPLISNLPNFSQTFLSRRKKDAVIGALKSTDVVVFKANSVENVENEQLPEIETVIPHSIARKMLFIVHVLQWKKQYRLPLGIVTQAVPQGLTPFEAERLLKIVHEVEYSVEEQEDSSVAHDAVRDGQLPLYDRAFTIDPEDAFNLDDAISLKLLGSDKDSSRYELAVHIVNAAKHIHEGTTEDQKARKLGTSVYAGVKGKTRHMLPPVLRKQLTLKPGSTRNVISIVAVVTLDGNNRVTIEGNVQTHKAQLKSSIRLTYKIAQEIMDRKQVDDKTARDVSQYNSTSGQPSLSESLQLLYKIAFSMRKERLRSAAYTYEVDKPERCCWQTHMMIEEFMVWANSAVAERVHDHFMDTALVRRQGAPNKQELAAVVSQQSYVMGYSHSLKCYTHQPFAPLPILIPTHTFSAVREAIQSGDVALTVNLLTSDHLYPQLAVAQAQIRSIQQRAEYHCTSSEESKTDFHHYSLNLDFYTHFTSPMRRYIDIQLQRMLLATLESSRGSMEPALSQFNRESHERLCLELNSANKNAKDFERNMKRLALAQQCTYSSEVMDAFVVSNERGKLELCFPDRRMEPLSFSQSKIKVKHLGSLGHSNALSDNPDDELMWRIKMTSLCPDFHFEEQRISEIRREKHMAKKQDSGKVLQESKEATALVEGPATVRLEMAQKDQKRSRLRLVDFSATITPLTIKIDPKSWQKAMNFVENPTQVNLTDLKEDFTIALKQISSSPGADKHECVFLVYHLKRSLSPHCSIKVWMTNSTRERVLMPDIQLVELAPGVRICLEHNSHPAECFSDPLLRSASKAQYNDIHEYFHLWEKVLLAEASEKSVKERQPIIIRDVSLKWPKFVRPEGMDQDHFEVTDEVVMELPPRYVEEVSEFFKIRVGDMVCVRYGTEPHSTVRSVFHMVVSKATSVEGAQKETGPKGCQQVKMKFIGKEHCRVSERMKKVLEEGATCEMQIVAMSTSYQRVYKNLMKLLQLQPVRKQEVAGHGEKAQENQLAHDIALGRIKSSGKLRTCQAALDMLDKDPLARTLWSSSSQELNPVQLESMKLAFSYRFQLIQGPPGTGKSETGAHIAYVFAMLNRTLPNRKCVLYCGPSNKAVDVVLGNLHSLNTAHPEVNLKLLRIYGRAVERRKYPGPFWNKSAYPAEESQYKVPDWASEYMYLLHDKIRQKSSPACQKLVALDEEFRRQSEDKSGCIPTSAEHHDYKKALSLAEEDVLREQFDIVLCTCNETASGRMSSGKFFTVGQCIIDECGMAYEPESMAPISLCEHVVLLGDHKQLQPVIDYNPAKEHGLARSLFQRYAEDAKELCYKLTIQYRMHENICEFPSNCFYDGDLETDISVKYRNNDETRLTIWPGGPNVPILFCDTVGREGEDQAGSKGERNIGKGSKFNIEEAKKVVVIASVLHHLHGVRLDEMALLTPYSAQRDMIRHYAEKANLLKEGASSCIQVASVTESQGDEYGIVILSTVRSQPREDIANREHVQPDRGWLLENLGFVTDEHQTNVGITRSKYGLIIVGNKALLRYDATWEKLLDHYKKKRCLVSASSFPKKSDLDRLCGVCQPHV